MPTRKAVVIKLFAASLGRKQHRNEKAHFALLRFCALEKTSFWLGHDENLNTCTPPTASYAGGILHFLKYSKIISYRLRIMKYYCYKYLGARLTSLVCNCNFINPKLFKHDHIYPYYLPHNPVCPVSYFLAVRHGAPSSYSPKIGQ